MDSVRISDILLEESSKLTDINTIYGKYYDKKNIPSNHEIISDFKELFNLYSQLKPDDNGLIIAYSDSEIKKPIPKYNTFTEFLIAEGFYFEPQTIENFLISLKTKPFVILTGNSGTGKTKIAQLFSEYLAIKKRRMS